MQPIDEMQEHIRTYSNVRIEEHFPL